MKAKVLFAFPGVEDGQIYPRQIGVGETVEGELAHSAINGGYAKMIGGAAENKMQPGSAEKKTGGRTGAAKPASSPVPGLAKTRKTSAKPKAKRG